LSAAARNRSNIQSCPASGRPGNVGGYHTHGTGFFPSAFSGMMTKAGCPSTRKAYFDGIFGKETFSSFFASGDSQTDRMRA
jgi:hypothetical protein